MKAANLQLSRTLGLGWIEDDVTETGADVEESGAVDDDLSVAALVVGHAPVAGVEVVGAGLVLGVDDRFGGNTIVGLLLDLGCRLHQGPLDRGLALQVPKESVEEPRVDLSFIVAVPVGS